MNLVKLLTSPTANALGWTLVHAIWQGFAIVLPTAVALHLLRSRSSALRYRLGILALAVQLLVSVATFSFYYEPIMPSVSTGATQLVAVPWQQSVQILPWHQQVRQFLEGHLSQFVVLYLIGLVIFGLRLAGGWLYLQRLSRLATPPVNALWNTLINQLRAMMVLRPVIQIRESASIAVPIVVGIMKPVLLIPVGLATSLSVQEVEAVLAHELAHIKRQDYAVNLLQSLIDVLYFFHPALWWLSARVREERELCCDDLAVQACGGDGRRLAQALARIEELRLLQTASTPALAMAFAQRRQQLLHRVRRILGVPTRSIVSTRSLAGLTLATILLVSASVYAVQQQQPKPKTPKKTKAKPTVRYQLGQRKEFGIINQSQIEYVIWNGERLSTKQVAKLSTQLQNVFAGTLSLDNIAQPNRDILLAIIESRYTSLSVPENRAKFRQTIDSLQQTDWYKQKTSTNPVDNDTTARVIPSNIPLALTDTTKVEIWNSMLVDGKWTGPIKDTSAYFERQNMSRLADTQRQLELLSNQMQKIIAQQQPVLDQVSKEMAELSVRHQELAKQLTPVHKSQLEQNQKLQELARLQTRLIMEKALEIANKAIEIESNMQTTANVAVKPSSTRTPRKPTAPTHRVIQGTVVKPTSLTGPRPVKPLVPQKPE